MNKNTRSTNCHFFQRVWAGAGVSLAVFLFLPLVVYWLNAEAVTTSKSSIMLIGSLCAAASACVLAALSSLPRVGAWVVALCRIGLVSVVVLTVFPNRTGQITGFDMVGHGSTNVVPVAKLLIALWVSTWMAVRRPGALTAMSVLAGVYLLLVTGYVALRVVASSDQRSAEPPHVLQKCAELARETNVIVVVFDSFTGYRMKEVFHNHPELRDELAGFKYYPNAIACAQNTPAGVCTILTGGLSTSLADKREGERLADSMEQSFLADGKVLGMKALLVSRLQPQSNARSHATESMFVDLRPRRLKDHVPGYMGFLAVSLSRIVPSSAADYVNNVVERLLAFRRKTVHADQDLLFLLPDEMERRALISKMALERFVDGLRVGSSKGTIITWHALLTHPPNDILGDGRLRLSGWEKGMQEETSLYAARWLARFCRRLRDLGVYDSTLIVVTADHGGIPLLDPRMNGQLSTDDGLAVYFNPLMMVKGPGDSGPCRDSETTVWLGDVAATVRDYLGVAPKGNEAFATRSLLMPDEAGRRLNVPLFFRPDGLDYHGSLKEWTRVDVGGVFRDYGAVVSSSESAVLRGKARVRVTTNNVAMKIDG